MASESAKTGAPAIQSGDWQSVEKTLINAGVPDNLIAEEASNRKQALESAGTPQTVVDQYFGVPEFDKKPAEKHFETVFGPPTPDNRQSSSTSTESAATPTASTPSEVKPGPKSAETFWDAFIAGGQSSVSGLIARHKNPDLIVTEDKGMAMRIAQGLGQFLGDAPFMEAGAIGGFASGALAGSEVPIAGNIVGGTLGAGAGALALPAAMRTLLMDAYSKGSVNSFGDFWEKISAEGIKQAAISGLKWGTVGAATAGTGALASSVVAPLAGPFATASAKMATEVATMTSVGKALEGQIPSPSDFMEAAIFVAGTHGMNYGAKRFATDVVPALHDIYAKLGTKPSDVVLQSEKDPVLGQELVSLKPRMDVIEERLTGQTPNIESATPVVPEEAKTLDSSTGRSEAVQTVLDTIATKPKVESKLPSARDIYAQLVDQRDPINEGTKAVGIDPKTLEASEDPYKLGRMAGDAPAKFEHFLKAGTFKYADLALTEGNTSPEITGKSYDEIVKPVKDDLQFFDGLLKARRLDEYYRKGRIENAELTHDEVKAYLKEATPEQIDAAKEFSKWRNTVLEYGKDAGLMSEDAYKEWTKNDSYVKFSRIFSEEEQASGKGRNTPSSFEKFTGESERLTESPIKATLEDAQFIFQQAEANRAKVKMVEVAENQPDQTVFKRLQAGEASSISTDRKFTLKENGETVTFETQPEFAKALRTLGEDNGSKNIATKLMSAFTSSLKIGTTVTPEFITKNALRDKGTAYIFGNVGVGDIAASLGTLFKATFRGEMSEDYKAFLRSGGAGGTFIDVSRLIESRIWELDKEGGGLSAAWNTINNVQDKWESLGRIIEQAPRLAMFKQIAGENTSGPSLFEGGYAARESTVDFERKGASKVLQAWNSITAFQGPAIQGLDRTIRAFKEDPTAFLTRGTVAITAPTMALWWAQKDDERYKNLNQKQKDLYWNLVVHWWTDTDPRDIQRMRAAGLPEYMIRQNGDTWQVDKGPTIKLVKPQELGMLFGTVPERLAESFVRENPRALKALGETMNDLLLPSWMPDAAKPIFEQAFNTRVGMSGPLVPEQMEKFLSADQAYPYTSDTAKALGQLIAKVPYLRDLGPENRKLDSPIVLENYISSWRGTIGKSILQVSDAALHAFTSVPDLKPALGLEDYPVIKAFVARYPSIGTQPIKDFEDQYRETAKIRNSLNARTKMDDQVGVNDIMQNYGDKLAKLDEVHSSLGDAEKAIRQIMANGDINGRDKRQLVEGLYYSMTEIAKAGVKSIDALDKEAKAKITHKAPLN